MGAIARTIGRRGRTDIAGSIDVTPSGGSTGKPIDAADLVDGFNTKTVNFAANETEKPVSFGIVDDSAVEGPETYRLTMSNPQPSGTLPNPVFVEGTVADNDSAPPSGVVFPASGQSGTTSNTGVVNVGSVDQVMTHPYKNGVTGGVYLFGMDVNGNGIAFIQQNDNIYVLRPVVAFDYGEPQGNNDRNLVNGNLSLNIPDGAQFLLSLDNGAFEVFVDGVQKGFGGSPSGKYDVSQFVKGTRAQYKVHAGAAIVDLKIIAQ